MNVRLFKKYDVERTDGGSEPGQKHEHCRYFVIDLDHDQHAIAALNAYAASCEVAEPDLAADLRNEVRVIKMTRIGEAIRRGT